MRQFAQYMQQGMAMQLDAGTRDLLRQELRQELRAEMRAELREEIRQEIIEAEVKARVAAEFESRIEAEVRDRVEAEVLKRLRVYIKEMEMARRRQFGRSTETSSAQYRLFDEADALAESSSDADDQAELPEENTRTTPRKPAKPRGKRQPLPADLPRVEIVHELPEDERTCPCGCTMAEIGEDVREVLDIIPMQIRVLRHVCKRYACSRGDSAPRTAPAPLQVLPKTNASNALLAMLLTTKYVDAMPLARFSNALTRYGVNAPRQTLARWVIGAAQALQPVHNLLRDHLLDSSVIHMDETTVQVLKQPGKATGSPGYMWVQKGGPPDKSVVIYDYDPSRSGKVPLRLLAGWQGYLMTDGYEGYNAVGRTEGIEHLVCWAHARRGFVKVVQAGKGKRGRANEAMEMIGRLYGIEREFADATDEARLEARQSRSKAVLAELRDWLDKMLPLVPPKTPLGQALGYLYRYWSRLVRYVERGDLPIDNNRCENAIRPFVVGRKNWLFSDTPAGAHASAVVYSLIETAKANGREPYAWLRHVLQRLPYAKTADDYEALLPWNLSALELVEEAIRA